MTAAHTAPKSSVILIDPAMARRMLKHNTRNRPVSPIAVERYRRDMENGRWIYAGDPIRFDTDGTLLDGQHRLMALAALGDEQGIALPFLVIRGLATESQTVMDQGRKRSAGQQLALAGIKEYTTVAAGVKIHLVRQTGLLFRDQRMAQTEISTAGIEQWVTANSSVVDGLHAMIRDIRANDAPPSVAYASAIAFWEIDPGLCREFFRLLRAGAGEGHPINSLDKRLQGDRRSKVRVSQREILGMFFQTWNLWREGRRTTRLQRPAGGEYTVESFPKLVAA